MKKVLFLTKNPHILMNKVKGQQHGYIENGYACDILDMNYSIKMVKHIFSIIDNYDIVHIRFGIYFLIMWPILSMALKNKTVIFEVPTPFSVYYHHGIDISNEKYLAKKLSKFLIKLIVPRVFKQADLIVQYAKEEYTPVVKYNFKTIVIENGINNPSFYGISDDYFLKQKEAINGFLNHQLLNFICIANLANHHGFDRLVEGIRLYYTNNNNAKLYNIKVHLISEKNACVDQILYLVRDYGLQEHIIFHGRKEMSQFKDIFEISNIAVGPIAVNRKNLTHATPLKVREYCYMGLPTLIDYIDYDLSNVDYVFHVPRDDTPIDIINVIDFYSNLIINHGDNVTLDIHNYSKNNFLWKNKIAKIIDGLRDRNLIK